MQDKYRKLRPLKREKYPREEHLFHYLKSDLFAFLSDIHGLSSKKSDTFLKILTAVHLRLVKRYKLAVFETEADYDLSMILLKIDVFFLWEMKRYDGLEGLTDEPLYMEYPFTYIFEIKRLLLSEYRDDLRRWQRMPYADNLYHCTVECERHELFEKLVACSGTRELFSKGMLTEWNQSYEMLEDVPELFSKRIADSRSKTAKYVLQIFVGLINLSAEEGDLYWKLDKISVGRG